ncbi:MAG: amino acid ABC transporter substrate-binding protein [Motiliproteus sp.]
MDTVWLSKPKNELDPREAYPLELLTTALKKSEPEFGPFEIRFAGEMGRVRALRSLLNGGINVFDAPSQPEWEEKALTVRIPIKKGLMGYRLLLINQNQLTKFSDIQYIGQLKQFSAGTGFQWSSTKVLDRLGFKLVSGTSYEGLFGMLAAARFDYFPRGINEIFDEYALFKPKYSQMAIEPTTAFYLPLPSYYFVSPHHPRLAKRIEAGLTTMYADGSFDELFFRFYGSAIEKAKLWQRNLFYLENPLLPPHPIYDNPKYWFDPTQRQPLSATRSQLE